VHVPPHATTGGPAGSPGERAADVYSAALVARPGGRLMHVLRLAGAVAAQLLLQVIPSPSVHDVVVTRRRDGAEVLREPAGDPLVAGDLLAAVRRELDELDPESFLAEWASPDGRRGR
jgi:hypothetical protein